MSHIRRRDDADDYGGRDIAEVRAHDAAMRAAYHAEEDGLGRDDERVWHLIRLAETARKTGDRTWLELLLGWWEDEALRGRRTFAAAAWLLLCRTAHFATLRRITHEALATAWGVEFFAFMLSRNGLVTDLGVVGDLDVPNDLAERLYERVIGKTTPWISDSENRDELQRVFDALIDKIARANDGGWERAAGA